MLRVAFYKGKGKIVDKLIRWWTNSPYSHCELLFPDGIMFSSDAWSGGVRWNTNYDLSNWDIVRVDLTKAEIDVLIRWCKTKETSDYDWLGVIRFVIPFTNQDPDKWFCSELCAAGLKAVAKLPSKLKVWKLSPGQLHALLINLG